MQNEIIAINYESGEPTVSARSLHEQLHIGTAFKDWFPRMCEYGFVEGTDFNMLKIERVQMEGSREVRREVTDCNISVDMAKQICMIQRTPEGKQCRQYLIDLEKAWNTPEQVMARAIKVAEETIERQKRKISEMRPKEIFADAVATSHTSILIGDLAKLLKQNGVDIGQKRLFAWMRDNGYLIKRQGSDWNMPTQRSMEMGLFEVKESTVNNPDGSVRINRTTKVTGKGQQYFINKFLGEVA
jgi:anti-repressor protein